MQYVILILLVLGAIILIISIINNHNEAKQRIKEFDNNMKTKFDDLNREIGYPINQGDENVKYNKGSLLGEQQALDKALAELGDSLEKSTNVYCDNINTLIDELNKLAKEYAALQLEKEKCDIILSIMSSLLTDEQLSQAEVILAERIKELKEIEQKVLADQQLISEINDSQDFEQGITPKLV